MSNYKKELGAKGETIALEYLKNKGYKILKTNYHTREGEIDIITSFLDKIIFIEVKTRASNRFGLGEEAIDEKKLESLSLAAEKYLQENNLEDNSWQIDLLTIDFSRNREGKIKHLENITF